MAIDLNFNKVAAAATTQVATKDLPKAEFWINIGYVQTIPYSDGTSEDKFISLPMGMPLDTMAVLPVKGSSEEFRALQTARNELREQLLEVAKTLKPGETKIVSMGNNGLGIEIRRVNGEQEAIPADKNPFVRKLALA